MSVEGNDKRYWVDLAYYDMETAKAMLVTKRYLYVGFMCHQASEKILKAYFVAHKATVPPRIHNLSVLAEQSGLYRQMNEEQKNLLDLLQPLNTEARYPTQKERLLQSLTPETCDGLVHQTEGFVVWTEKQL